MTAPPASPSRELALEMTGVSKTFGPVAALRDVSFAAAAGSVHALLGENGAGKSTLMRIAYGLAAADAGRVQLFGSERTSASVREAIRLGVGMVHQHLSLVPAFTAAENVALGGRGRFVPERAVAALQSLAAQAGLQVPVEGPVRDFSVVERQRLEILKALSRGARLLILDEPTTGLAPAEITDLLRWIRSFADGGGTVVLVTHRLREALAVADEITILRRGTVVHQTAVGAASATTESLARAMFPDAAAVPGAASTATSAIVVELDGVSVSAGSRGTLLRNVSLRVHAGDIIGVAAVDGSGHGELLAVLAGLIKPTAGAVRLPRRIAVIPSDRQRDALIPAFSLVENVALRNAGARRGRMPWKVLAGDTRGIVERFGIRAPSPEARARELSGGNQQRLVVGRELSERVDLVVADDPNRGLDLHATRFVFGELASAAAGGAAVVVYSSELDDVLAIATRVLVVYHGEVRELPPDRELVARAMVGA